MKVFVASIMLVFTVGVGSVFADCGWVLWKNARSHGYDDVWFPMRGVPTYEHCMKSAEEETQRAFDFSKLEESKDETLVTGRNGFAVIQWEREDGSGALRFLARDEFMCFSTATDPREQHGPT